MRIAFVARNVVGWSSYGVYLAETCSRLAKNHDVHIIAGRFEGMPSGICTLHQARVPQKPEEIKAWLFMIQSSIMGWNLRRKLDLVVTERMECSFLPNAVLDVHEPASIYNARVKGRPLVKRFRQRVMESYEAYLFPKRRGRIIVHSEGNRRDICDCFGLSPRDVAVAPLGVDLIRFAPENRELSRSRLRHALGIPENAFVILYIGEDWRRKGLRHAIDSLAFLGDAHSVLVVVGRIKRDDLSPYVGKDVAWERIRLVSQASEIAEYYAMADVFVLPSHSESFSLVSYEAAASGIPVLATRLPGIEDLILEGENGFFIEAEPRHIASKVDILYRNPQLRRQMGARARQTAAGFSWDETARKMESILLEIHEAGRAFAA